MPQNAGKRTADVDSSPVGWVHLVGGQLICRGPHIFFKYGKAGEKQEQGGQHFSRGGPGHRGPPDSTGLIHGQLLLSLLCILSHAISNVRIIIIINYYYY